MHCSGWSSSVDCSTYTATPKTHRDSPETRVPNLPRLTSSAIVIMCKLSSLCHVDECHFRESVIRNHSLYSQPSWVQSFFMEAYSWQPLTADDMLGSFRWHFSFAVVRCSLLNAIYWYMCHPSTWPSAKFSSVTPCTVLQRMLFRHVFPVLCHYP